MKKSQLRFTAFLLIITFIFCMFSGCDNSNDKNTAVGTQAAKLLLANERLDTKILNESVKAVFGADNSDKLSYGSTGDFLYGSFGKFNLPFLNQVGTFKQSGNTYEWSNFGDYSNISSFFDSYKTNAEGAVKQTIDMIDMAKSTISVTDVWVGDDIRATMLSVQDTSETLYERNEYGYRICKRYTNSEAQNTYEIYQCDIYDGGNKSQLHMLCIPEQRYEFSITTQGMGLYLIMENTRGYWNMLCISDVEHGANITNIMTSSGVSYVFDYYMPYGASSPEHSQLKIITADRSCDLISVNGNSITLYPSGFHGINCLRVTADASEVSHGESMSNTAKIMEIDGTYSTNLAIPSIVLSNGTIINPDDTFMNGLIKYQYGNVAAVADGYHSRLDFTVEGTSLIEKLNNFNAFLIANGIQCKANMSTIISQAPTGEILLNQFLSSYNWNGYTINRGANISQAIQAEQNDFSAYETMYETVKDYELLSYDELHYSADISELDFASLDAINMGNVNFENYNISVKDMSVTLSDLTLIEANTNYTIQLAYAATSTDEEGNLTYDPCSVYPFSSDNKVLTTYTEGDTLTVNQTATFNSYGILDPNTFHVVAYVATADGIRVSQMVPVVFSSDISVTETLPMVNLNLSTNENKNLVAVYEYNNDILLEVEEGKESYSYKEVYQLLLNGVLNHGEPMDTTIEISQDEDISTWTALKGNETLKSCIVRMKYTKNTNAGVIEGYVYAQLQ